MSNSQDISTNMLQHLQQRAKQYGYTTDELLDRLLQNDTNHAIPARLCGRLFDHTHDIVVLLDSDLRSIYVNPVIKDIIGIDPIDIIGQTDTPFGVSDSIALEWKTVLQGVIQAGEEAILEFNLETLHGAAYFEARLTPIFDETETESIEYILAIVRDISVYKQSQEEAQRAQSVLQRIFDNTQFLLAYMDADFNFIQVNERYAQADNSTPDDFVGKNHFELYPNAENHQLFRKVVESGEPFIVYAKPFVYPLQPERGKTYWDWSLVPVHDDDGTVEGLILTLFDVTEHKRTERQLLIKESAIASSITAIALTDLKGKLIYVNQSFLTLWKLDHKSQVLGRSIQDFWNSSDTLDLFFNTIETQESYIGETRASLADGTEAYIELIISIVKDEEGNPINIMGSFKDITIEKQAESYALELERLKAHFQKEQTHNMLVQRIVSTLSHDLRTTLSVIGTSRNLLHNYFDRLTLERRHEILDTIGRQVNFAVEILSETVNIARGYLDGDTFSPSAVNLAALCQISINEIQATSEGNHKLAFVNQTDLQVVSVDEVLVSRILLNLLSNAIKYSPEGSEIRLELDRKDEHRGILRVIDNGIGISEQDLPRIFDPLYRSDSVEEIRGTGLGLSIVKECVERHHGNISIESQLGKGTTITVELPITEPL